MPHVPAEAAPARLTETAAAHRRAMAARFIEDAAIELFAIQPMETVTVARIAESAGVSLRTFYRYFASKEEILLAQPVRRAEQIAAGTLAGPVALGPFPAMRAAIAALSGSDDLELRRWQRAVVAGRAGDRMSQQVVAVTSPILTRALAARAGTDPAELWADVAGVTVATALVTGARRWSQRGGSLAEHILAAVDIVGRGLERA